MEQGMRGVVTHSSDPKRLNLVVCTGVKASVV